MDRYTARNDNGGAYYPKCFEEPCMGMDEALEECKTCKMTFDIAERLAAYEDFELLPEQLRELDGMYRNVCEKLAEYQKLEEQGLLLKLKGKLGQCVYMDSEHWGIIPYKISYILFNTSGYVYTVCAFENDVLLDEREIEDEDFGKTVFLSETEAQEALERMVQNE